MSNLLQKVAISAVQGGGGGGSIGSYASNNQFNSTLKL